MDSTECELTPFSCLALDSTYCFPSKTEILHMNFATPLGLKYLMKRWRIQSLLRSLGKVFLPGRKGGWDTSGLGESLTFSSAQEVRFLHTAFSSFE